MRFLIARSRDDETPKEEWDRLIRGLIRRAIQKREAALIRRRREEREESLFPSIMVV